jgi:NADH dehydrogenase/NADH:ubiquinone oxidoreductase subunit G
MACLVRIVATGRIVPSCATPAEDGLEIESESDEIRALRRTALELLLSDHPCQVEPAGAGAADAAAPAFTCDCEKSGQCRLRKYALDYGCDPHRYAGTPRSVARAHAHPQLRYDPRKCILCGICVQLARQAAEPLGLAIVGRGFEARVAVPLDGTLAAAVQTSAPRLAGACPTGALLLTRQPADAGGAAEPKGG